MCIRDRYTPFGEELQSPAANDNLGGFTGHIKDSDTGLNYMQARYYDPVIGRFLSVDPMTFMILGDPGYFNRYAYLKNDPINDTDPTGMCGPATPLCVWGAGLLAGGGTVAAGTTATVSTTTLVTTTLGVGVMAVAIENGNNAQEIDDGTELVRGGDGSKPWVEGTGVTVNPDGTLDGVSTFGEKGSSTEETTREGRIRNGQIRTTTVGEIKDQGGEVIPDGGSGKHCTVNGCTPEQLDEAIGEPQPNPNKGGRLNE